MAVFRYQAVNEERLAVSGTIAADTPRQAREQLRARGLRIRELSAQRQTQSRWKWLKSSRRPYATSWALCVHELAMLLTAGIPLLDALDTIVSQHRGGFRAALLDVRERVAAGSGLAEALRQRPDVFDELSINLVEVGENTGAMEEVLRQLSDFQQRQLRLKDQVLNALAYPMFLVAFGTAATVFLMTAVMPPLLENLQETLDQLPWPTRVVKAGSDLLVGYGWLILGCLAGLVILAAVALQIPNVRRRWHGLILKTPGLGNLVLKQSISRVSMVLATLLRSGMVLTRSLELATGATRNLVVRDAIDVCRRSVSEGVDVSKALERAGVFPPQAIQVFSVGQESGNLEHMLEQLSDDYQQQVTTISERFAALLEPALIVVLAVAVGFVLVATILPILEAGNVL